MEVELLIKAIRKKFRFPSDRGELSMEQLWDVPLTHPSGFSLDAIAKDLNRTAKSDEESFVTTAKINPETQHAAERLEIVKYVIKVRLAENEARLLREAKAQERRRLLDLLADKETQALQALSVDQIKEKLAALDA